MFDDISDSVGAIFDPVFEHTLGFYEASFPSDPFDLLPKLCIGSILIGANILCK